MNARNLVVLIHPGHVSGEYPYMPYESLFLAKFLEKNGYEVMLIDQRVEDDWAERLAPVIERALWVGLTSITGPQIRYGLRTCAWIRKQRPDLPLVWGGWHVTFVPETSIAHPLIDYIVAGIGELKILDLCRHIENGEKGIPENKGILHKDYRTTYNAHKESFEDLPDLPAYHLIDIEKYRSERNMAGMISSRGCPFRCAFCTIAQISYINRGVEPVIKELKFLVEEHKFKEICFSDGLFFAQRSRVNKILDRVDEEGLNFSWQSTVRPETFTRWTDEGMERIRKSGLRYVNTGVESGSEDMLQRIKKDAKVEDILATAEVTRRHDIGITMSFLSGLPYETVEDLKASIGVIEKLVKLNPKMRILNPFYQPLPGAPSYDEMIKTGWAAPKSLEDWGESINYNQTIDDIDPFPWMSATKFREYKSIFSNSILEELRLMVLEQQ